ncbi:reverse transcriptase domain-containing protein [Tanacetum coccineum]
MMCTFVIRQMAYGAVPDALGEYMQMGVTRARKCLQMFCKAIMELYGEEFLRKPTYTDMEKLYAHHEEKHGFPVMLGSIDCTASNDLWIWHAIFGVSGMNNDVNVLRQSPLCNDLKVKASDVSFVANNTKHEAARKDVERAFGVLKKKWKLINHAARGMSCRTRKTPTLEVQGTYPGCEDLLQQIGAIRGTLYSIYRSIRMTCGSLRGIPRDDIGATPSGISENIVRATSSGAPEETVRTPLVGVTPFAREQIEGHLSALRSLVKEHNIRGNVSSIHLSFKDEEDRTKVWTVVTGKEIVDADLKRPFKEALYDGTTDPEDHLSRFSYATNSGEWPMPVWCRMFQQTLDGSVRGWFKNLLGGSIDGWVEIRQQFTTRCSTRRACFKDPTEITKIVRKVNETLVAVKERWIVEIGFIAGVPGVMKISSFMDAHKCPELAKRYSNKVPKTVDEMTSRLDDFVRSKETFASI